MESPTAAASAPSRPSAAASDAGAGGPRSRRNKKPRFKKKATKCSSESGEIAGLRAQYAKVDVKKVKTFAQLPLSRLTQKGLADAGFTEPTAIQRESICLALKGLDILGAAKTGSGKTLAFLVPLLELLFVRRWSRPDGLGALVITPTRELAYQIFEALRKVGCHHDFSAGLVIGGKDLAYERARLSACNIIICTPGRLLQHMDENPVFSAAALQLLVLDEADRCLDLGFAPTLDAIVANLPAEGRQTLLFSATQTRSVKDLARLSLISPVFVSVHEKAANATPDELSQHYSIADLGQKFELLWSFIKNHKRKKVLVFLQSCKQVRFAAEAFRRLRCGAAVLALYGSLHQLKRMRVYDEFCAREGAVALLATDVAARGLDFPAVDWVLQIDCPEDATTYLHRVGRTARAANVGQSLLVLLPSEAPAMLKQLKAYKIPIEKIEVNPKKLTSVQRKLEAHVAADKDLKSMAQRAFQTYLKSIYLMRNKAVFDAAALPLAPFAASLGLAQTPRVRFVEKQLRLKEEASKRKTAKAEELISGGGGDADDGKFSAACGSDSEEEDGDILTVKRRDHALDDADEDAGGGGEAAAEDEAARADEGNAKRAKVVTKVAAAKKVLRKKIQANQVIHFDESGATVSDGVTSKSSAEGRAYELDAAGGGGGGIDLARARAALRAEDAFDRRLERQRVRQKHKDERRRLKEMKRGRGKDDDGDAAHGGEVGSDDGDDGKGADLDWLPDPDKVYGPVAGGNGVAERAGRDEDEGSGSESKETADDGGGKLKWKAPKRRDADVAAGERCRRSKRPRVEAEDDAAASDEEEGGQALLNDEDLALRLLQQ